LSPFFYSCSSFDLKQRFLTEGVSKDIWQEYIYETSTNTFFVVPNKDYKFKISVSSSGKILTFGLAYLPIIPLYDFLDLGRKDRIWIGIESDLNINNLTEFFNINFNGREVNYKGNKHLSKDNLYYYSFVFEVDNTYINEIELSFNKIDINNEIIVIPNLILSKNHVIRYRNHRFAH
jgi:hypothetical protein